MKKALVLVAVGLGLAFACGPTNDPARTGVTFNTTDGGPKDAGTHDAGPVDAGHDAGPTEFTCAEIVLCANNCSDQACAEDCYNQGSPTAQSQFQTLAGCVNTACPSTTGGPCATQGATCDTCLQNAQAGTCSGALQTCQTGTSTQPDAGNNTGTIGCRAIITCGNNCTTQQCLTGCINQGDTNAQTLFNALDDCIATNCASSCQTQGTACNTCVQNVQGTGGACYSALSACSADQ